MGIIGKSIVVLLIPYYLILDSHASGALRAETTYLISGLIGYTSSPGIIYEWPDMPTVFWEQNQVIFSLLFISPMILFSFCFAEYKTGKKSIIIGIGAILISILSLNLLSPYYTLYGLGTFYFLVPNVVSVSIFVFVFWTLLRNTWRNVPVSENPPQKERKFAKMRDTLGEWFPGNISTLIWMCMTFIPAFITIYLQSIETSIQYGYHILGGIYFIYYDYRYFTSGFGSSTFSTLYVELGSGTSLYGQILWIANVILGIFTLQYIRKEIPRKRFNTAIGIVLLINIIPPIFYTFMANAFVSTGFFQIPLPIFPVIMLLLAKFAHMPEGYSEDMIEVPLRTRISSFFQRDSSEEEQSDIMESGVMEKESGEEV